MPDPRRLRFPTQASVTWRCRSSTKTRKNDGKTIYRLHVKDVPVDGFWSISLYNQKGHYEQNPYNAYSLNNITAKKDADGSVSVQFGRCGGKILHCLPIMGWLELHSPPLSSAPRGSERQTEVPRGTACSETNRASFPTFPPPSTSFCTTPAPCPSPLSRLPSNDALLLTSKLRRNPTNFALFGENPQLKPPFFASLGHLPPINTGIRTANTTCCALYLTHPTEGVTFTTATPKEPFASLSKYIRFTLFFIAPLPPTPSPPGSASQLQTAEKSSQNRAQTH
jgi:hypothetical protein